MNNQTSFVSLTGGLGNQLFQLAEGLSRQNSKVVLISSLGKPRTTNGKPDLVHFDLQGISEYRQLPEASLLTRKAAGFLLRMGLDSKTIGKVRIVRATMVLLGQTLISLHVRRWVVVKVCQGIGFSEIKPSDQEILIGYFQHSSHSNESQVRSKLMRLAPVNHSARLLELIEKAKRELPIFLHYRFTDYLSQAHFGNLSQSYYVKALQHLDIRKRKIWVFTDDLNVCKSRFPIELSQQTYFVDDSGLHATEVLHLFRHGSDYIIANSSFSFWGAYLRFNSEARVISPSPWFKKHGEPYKLIPDNWIRESSEWD